MQVLRLLAAAVSTITAAHSSNSEAEEEEDEGPFFDLDFSSSVRPSSSSSCSSESDDACSDLDFIISLHRSRSASPSYSYHHKTTLDFSTKAGIGLLQQSQYAELGGFGVDKKAPRFYGGRPSFASSGRSLRLFMESPTDDEDDDASSERKRGAPSSIRRYLTKISRRLLRRSVRTRGDTVRGIHIHPQRRRLRKSRSASAAVVTVQAPSPYYSPIPRRDDSLIEKQDGIASAIAHCKESFHRASLSESLSRSRSDPGGEIIVARTRLSRHPAGTG